PRSHHVLPNDRFPVQVSGSCGANRAGLPPDTPFRQDRGRHRLPRGQLSETTPGRESPRPDALPGPKVGDVKQLEFWLRLTVKALLAGCALVREISRLLEQVRRML